MPILKNQLFGKEIIISEDVIPNEPYIEFEKKYFDTIRKAYVDTHIKLNSSLPERIS